MWHHQVVFMFKGNKIIINNLAYKILQKFRGAGDQVLSAALFNCI